MTQPYIARTSSYTAGQLRWAIRERKESVAYEHLWPLWDEECRYIAGLLIAGGDYDGVNEPNDD